MNPKFSPLRYKLLSWLEKSCKDEDCEGVCDAGWCELLGSRKQLIPSLDGYMSAVNGYSRHSVVGHITKQGRSLVAEWHKRFLPAMTRLLEHEQYEGLKGAYLYHYQRVAPASVWALLEEEGLVRRSTGIVGYGLTVDGREWLDERMKKAGPNAANDA